MKVTICKSSELGASELTAWRFFQQSSQELRSPFFSPEFVCALGRHKPGVQIAVVEDNGKIVAFFPYERGKLGMGKAVGLGLTDKQGIIHAPDFKWRGMELLEACNLITCEFDSLISAQIPYFAPQEYCVRPSSDVDLSEGWEARTSRRYSERRFKQIRQRERKLRREIGDVQYEFASRSNRDLERLMNWKSTQYRRTCRSDRFARKWFVDAVQEMFEEKTNSFSLNLSTMRAGDRLVSLDLSLVANGVMAGWFPAYDRDYSRYGVGLLHLRELLKLAAKNRICSYELGAGDEEYKNAFGDRSYSVATGLLSRQTGVALAHWVRMVPKRAAVRLVMQRPALRKAARDALNQIGRIRCRLPF